MKLSVRKAFTMTSATGSGTVSVEVGSGNVIPEPEIHWTGNGGVSDYFRSDDVTPEPEVVVHPVENPSPDLAFSELRSGADEGAQQYIYDDIDGHYSPAGRGYPHGFHHFPPVIPKICTPFSPTSPDDQDNMVPDLCDP